MSESFQMRSCYKTHTEHDVSCKYSDDQIHKNKKFWTFLKSLARVPVKAAAFITFTTLSEPTIDTEPELSTEPYVNKIEIDNNLPQSCQLLPTSDRNNWFTE